MPGMIQVEVQLPVALATAPERARAAIAGAVTEIALDAETAAKGYAPSLTGAMRSAIATVPASMETLTAVVSAPIPYSRFVESGTGPQHVPDARSPYTPPFAPIESWARARGLSPGAVWQSIRAKGTRPHPFMEPAARGIAATAAARIRAALAAVLGGAP